MKKIVLMLCLPFTVGVLAAQQQPAASPATQEPYAAVQGVSAAAIAPAPESEAGTPASEYSVLASLSPQDYLNLNMPPLHVLLENARNAPQSQYYEANRDIEERELRTIRRSWMSNFRLNANYSYGMGDVYTQSYNQEVTDPLTILSGQRQNRWNVGVVFSMPISDITNRRNKIRQQQRRVEMTDYDRERWYDNLKMEIIDVYTSAIENFSMLETISSAMAMARAQYTIAETDFINGHIDAAMLSRQKSIENSAVREYEQVRSALNSALLRLEVLTNTRILTREPAKDTPAAIGTQTLK